MLGSKRLKVVVCLVICVLLASVGCTSGKGNKGEKTITVTVTHKDGTENKKEASTNAEFLTQAMEEMGLLEPDSGDDGYYVTVDGETADTDKQEWWCLTTGGETTSTGFDDTPLEDGESYEITFTEGW